MNLKNNRIEFIEEMTLKQLWEFEKTEKIKNFRDAGMEYWE